MKLCPQCDFIYEDEQGLCDMDGKELVYHPAPVAVQQSVMRPTRLTIDLPARSPRRFPVLLLGVVVLATLLSVIYFAQLYRSRSSNPDHSAIRTSGQSTAHDTTPQTSPSNLAGAVGATSLPEQAEGVVLGETPPSAQSSAAKADLIGVRPASGLDMAGVPSGNSRQPIILRLKNGASIKVDEAWETRDGIWYRQGGMVTMLKRSQVEAIERPASRSPRSSSVAGNTASQNRRTSNAVAENRPRIDRPDPPDTTKDSRVTSFLKKTGRILKKPFKF